MKIMVVQCFSDSGFSTDRIFVGNEFSRDPADIIQLATEQFKQTIWGDGHFHIQRDEDTYYITQQEAVFHFLHKNGYTEVTPKRIIT